LHTFAPLKLHNFANFIFFFLQNLLTFSLPTAKFAQNRRFRADFSENLSEFCKNFTEMQQILKFRKEFPKFSEF